MTKNKVETMIDRIATHFESYIEDGMLKERPKIALDPHKLAEVLCEMEERIEKAPIEHCGVEDCPECNKEAYKSGYLAALEEVKDKLDADDPKGVFYTNVRQFLDELKKEYE